MKVATKRAIAEIERLSNQMIRNPEAAGKKLTNERTLLDQMVNQAREGLLAANHTKSVPLFKGYVLFDPKTGDLFANEGGGPRTLESIIQKEGDFDIAVTTLRDNLRQIARSLRPVTG